MILIGTLNIKRTRETGDFYCPTCAGLHSYRMRSSRPFLTLYFIPVIPIGGAEMFVQCDHCRSTWDPSVLQMDQKQHEQAADEQFRLEAIRSAVLVVLADGHITEAEISALEVVVSRLLERPVSRDEIGEICSIATQNQIEAGNYVLTISRGWNQTQRKTALQAMFLAASAGGELNDEQLKTLAKMRDILEFTDSEYETAIGEALQWDAPN
tara:strand:+ start:62644 stop:63276 length:633 start_codon:yes stop_codon:yes gene_type:complete